MVATKIYFLLVYSCTDTYRQRLDLDASNYALAYPFLAPVPAICTPARPACEIFPITFTISLLQPCSRYTVLTVCFLLTLNAHRFPRSTRTMSSVTGMIPGQRFEVDLDSSDDEQVSQTTAAAPFNFVGEIQERKPAAPKPPIAPTLKKNNNGGFPSHHKRPVESRFKQRKAGSQADVKNNDSKASPKPSSSSFGANGQGKSSNAAEEPLDWAEQERQQIDQENSQKLAGMSAEEIAEERGELMNNLSPAFLERLLKRSNIESGSNETRLDQLGVEDEAPRKPKDSSKKVTFAQKPDVAPAPASEDTTTGENVGRLNRAHVQEVEHLPHDSVHFPQPPQPADLDPSSSTFFDDLHTKYFPSLPSDPGKLAWMQPNEESNNGYTSAHSELNPKDIRFSFKGELLPPNTAAEIPVGEGLHHHGDSPDAAGYTIPELAHLARSSFPGQRCIAFQTVGRILFRLGKNEFGDPGEPGANTVGAEDTFGELARSLWREMDRERVVDGLIAESEGSGVDGGRHVSAKAYATEAVWLWRKGGGRKWRAE